VHTANVGLRDRFLLGRMLLRDLAAEAGGVRAEAVEVTAVCERCGAEHGRPRLRWADAQAPPPTASLASCAHLVVAAIAPTGVAVGVDVEPARMPREADAARRRAIVELLGGTPRTAVRRWVRAEAVLKADGRGLRVEPGQVAFSEARGARDGVTARVLDAPTVYDLADRRIEGCLVSLAVARPTS
jgi:4'-phosphopantetheinyl transferase